MLSMKTVILAAAVAVACGGGPALAQSCQEDIAKISARRQAMIEVMNRAVKASHGKLDPVTSCPKLRNLAAIEGEFVAYMVKNKEWCHVPDEALANVQASQRKTSSVASRACNVAVQVRRQQQQQQQQASGGGGGQQPQAQRLPSGPL